MLDVARLMLREIADIGKQLVRNGRLYADWEDGLVNSRKKFKREDNSEKKQAGIQVGKGGRGE